MLKYNGYLKGEKLKNILFCIGIFIANTLFTQESLSYIVVNDSMAFDWTNNETITVNTGGFITTNSRIFFGSNYRDSKEHHIITSFRHLNNTYSIFSKNLLPENTKDKFGDDIFIDYPPDIYVHHGQALLTSLQIGDVDKMWVPAYYCEILLGKDRDVLLKFIPGLNVFSDIMAGYEYFWYDNTNADIQNVRVMFYNSAIKLGLGTHFAVRNINKTNFGYRVDCVESIENIRFEADIIINSTFWNKYNPGDSMTLLLYLDGDYLDIYVDGLDVHLGTFVKVQREFIKQYQSLIKINTASLTNVIWPRRADGSMDYPPPSVNASNAQSSSQEIEQPLDSETSLENESPQTTKDSQFPLWIFIGVGLVLLAAVGVFVVRKKKG